MMTCPCDTVNTTSMEMWECVVSHHVVHICKIIQIKTPIDCNKAKILQNPWISVY